MEEIKLDVLLRQEIGSNKIRKTYREGFIPAIVYGEKKKAPTVIKVDRKRYEGIMRHHRDQNVLFHLNVLDGEKKLRDYNAIVKEEQHDPVSSKLTHIDFMRISLTEEITVKVAIETKGEPVGVKRDGGSFEHIMWELEVICLPTNIPGKIEVDVSKLEIGDTIHVSDLILPKNVRTKQGAEGVVVTVAAPMKEVAPDVVPDEALTEPEVTKEKKKEEKAPEGKVEEKKKDEKAEKPAK